MPIFKSDSDSSGNDSYCGDSSVHSDYSTVRSVESTVHSDESTAASSPGNDFPVAVEPRGKKRPRSFDTDSFVWKQSHHGGQDLNQITWGDETFYSSYTLEEYAQVQNEMDELIKHPPGWDDPNTYVEESAYVCHECFPLIQEQFPEMADAELVETMGGNFFLTWSVFSHCNIKIKLKNGEVSTYFVEVNMIERKVRCFSKFNKDPSSDMSASNCIQRCRHCEPEDVSPLSIRVYHPADCTWLGAPEL